MPHFQAPLWPKLSSHHCHPSSQGRSHHHSWRFLVQQGRASILALGFF
uniref:Uncharacterized protein n=1 Tax=Fagus sylvatica TaxID=28930 RepID=A0A2N9HVW2_FAGSY